MLFRTDWYMHIWIYNIFSKPMQPLILKYFSFLLFLFTKKLEFSSTLRFLYLYFLFTQKKTETDSNWHRKSAKSSFPYKLIDEYRKCSVDSCLVSRQTSLFQVIQLGFVIILLKLWHCE